jgi:hypothetical protein
MKHWVLAGCLGWLVAMPLASGCGDDEGDEGPGGEMCFQAGGLDNRCRCSGNQPMGIRRCQDNLIWSECVCPEPYDEPCERGETVECRCPGDDRIYTTECLGAGTFDCECDSRGAAGNGD